MDVADNVKTAGCCWLLPTVWPLPAAADDAAAASRCRGHDDCWLPLTAAGGRHGGCRLQLADADDIKTKGQGTLLAAADNEKTAGCC